MSNFSVVIVTAPPAGMSDQAGGAFVKIDGREAILRSAELFLNRDNVKQIQVVFLPEQMEEGKRKFGGHLGLFGVKMISGGPKWIDQIAAAGEKVSADASHVIVHDAARPAVPYSDVDAIMEAAEKSAAISLAAPIRSSIVELDEGGGAAAFHSPSRYMQLLTPQAFSIKMFKEMAAKKSEPHASTYKLISGSGLNVRVGGGGDAALVKTMINMLPKPKVKGPSNPFEEAQW